MADPDYRIHALTPDCLGRYYVWDLNASAWKIMAGVDAAEALALGSISMTNPAGKHAIPDLVAPQGRFPRQDKPELWTYTVEA